ncbi:MAG: right-handed parallel beta-helix repeat-containing protein [Bacteroidota bacterium]
MRVSFTVLLLMMFAIKAIAQTSNCPSFVVKNIIKDFGAKADGITNDHAAFKAAADFFNKRGGCGKLIIPFGLYKVGIQKIDTPKTFLVGSDVLSFTNVSNFSVEGVVNKGKYPVIKYANSLYYGAFYYTREKFGLPDCTPTKRNFNNKCKAQIGTAIAFNSCKDVSVKNIDLDGNIDNVILGGSWGDVGRQIVHVGVYTGGGRNIKLINVNAHHFGLDGLENAGANNLYFENVVSEYNGRQGFSWVDGDSLIAINCKFNHSGRVAIHSSPGAGIDIEPERKHDISYARFTNCEIGYNRGCGLLMAVANNFAKDMVFNKCTFIGLYNWSAWVPGIDIHFNDCTFYGNVVHTVSGKKVQQIKDMTSFTRCYFTDIYKGMVTKKPGGYYMPLNNERVVLDSCLFKTFDRGFLWHSEVCGLVDSLTSQLKNSTVYVANEGGWQGAFPGIKIINTKMYYLPGRISLNCPQDYTNFTREVYTKEKMEKAFPEMIDVVPFADSVKFMECDTAKIMNRQNAKLSRRPMPEKIKLLFAKDKMIVTNTTKAPISGSLNIYNKFGKQVLKKSNIILKAGYTKGVELKLPAGNYTAKFIQNKLSLATFYFDIP